MLAALAEGTSELRHFSASADCHSTLGCMDALGAGVRIDQDTVRITGHGPRGLKRSWRALDAGNSGTTMRLLAGILAGQDFASKLTGDDSLRKRFMQREIRSQNDLGAQARAYVAGAGRVRGGGREAGTDRANSRLQQGKRRRKIGCAVAGCAWR